MCGICGVIDFRARNSFEFQCAQMVNSLKHRGPNDSGQYNKDSTSLGHTRLSIIDLTSAGHQPMYSDDKRFVIVFNGEIYNYQDLKKDLNNYPFKSNSDTEVLIAAYCKYGPSMLDKLNGMYAFAIWDNQDKKLFLARDRLGEKPLYYCFIDNILVFASEIRAILKTKLFTPAIDHDSIHELIHYQSVHSPNTIISNIKFLEPATYLTISLREGFKKTKYWNPQNFDTNNVDNYDSAKVKIRELLDDSLKLRLISDVPVGAFLSGGIDSSIVVAIMSKYSSEINTFSVNFAGQNFNEAIYADAVSRRFATRHHVISQNSNDVASQIKQALMTQDHPSGDGPNVYLVSKAVKEMGISVALSGVGGDELFCGYKTFKYANIYFKNRFYNHTPSYLKDFIATLISTFSRNYKNRKFSELLGSNFKNIENFYRSSRALAYQESIINFSSTRRFSALNVLEGKLSNNNYLMSKVSIAEIEYYLHDTLLRDSDQMSMANSLEIRAPFLDHRLIEYVLSLNDSIKFKSTPKQLLVDSFADLIEPSFFDRKKIGFTLPWNLWLRNQLSKTCADCVNDFMKRKFVNKSAVKDLYQNFLNNDLSVFWSQVWIIIVIESWLKANDINE